MQTQEDHFKETLNKWNELNSEENRSINNNSEINNKLDYIKNISFNIFKWIIKSLLKSIIFIIGLALLLALYIVKLPTYILTIFIGGLCRLLGGLGILVASVQGLQALFEGTLFDKSNLFLLLMLVTFIFVYSVPYIGIVILTFLELISRLIIKYTMPAVVYDYMTSDDLDND